MDDIATIYYGMYCYKKDDGITKNQLFILSDPNPTLCQMVQHTKHTNNTFYWKIKKPRFKLTQLQQSTHQGGLEAPNFQHHYLANQLQCLIKLIYATHHRHPWLDIEQIVCHVIAITDLPFLSDTIKKPQLLQKQLQSLQLSSLVES